MYSREQKNVMYQRNLLRRRYKSPEYYSERTHSQIETLQWVNERISKYGYIGGSRMIYSSNSDILASLDELYGYN